MASDANLIRGAREAYTNYDAKGMAKAGQGLDTITTAVNAWAKGKVEEKKKFDTEVEDLQTKLNETITNEAATSKALGKSEYNAFKGDARAIRDRLLEAKRSGDVDAQQDAQIELNELMNNSQKLKDSYEAIGESIPELDMKAMTQEGRDAFENFKNNPTREHFRNEDGEDAYRWQVLGENGQPVQDTNEDGSPKVDPDTKQPVYKTQSYTPDQINDFGVMPQTANGTLLKDYELEQAELYDAGGRKEGAVDVEKVRKKVGSIIPKDKNALRSWARSNPSENDDLDIEGYLIDNISRVGNYKELGVKDTNGDGVINENDLVSVEDREAFLQSIMNADNPGITHSILTEVMTNITYNKATGKQSKDYTPDGGMMMDGSSQQSEEETDEMTIAKVDGMKDLVKNGAKPGENMADIKKRLNLSAEDLKSGIMIDGKLVMPETIIAPAIKKRAGGSLNNL